MRLSTAFTVHAGPPLANASLNLPSVVPVLSPHAGRVTQVSRGMLTPSARLRSPETCSTIVVSLCPRPLAVWFGSPNPEP